MGDAEDDSKSGFRRIKHPQHPKRSRSDRIIALSTLDDSAAAPPEHKGCEDDPEGGRSGCDDDREGGPDNR